MKKRIMSLAAAAVLFLFASACSCISVNINIRPAASKDYSTVFEQSELRWYISEKYGEKAVSDYCFYDLDDHGEVSCVVAQRYTSGNGPEMLMHVFNRDIADWYCYNNDILVSARSEKYTEIEGIGPVYRLTMYADIDPRNEYTIDSGTYYVYLTYNKSGLLDRIFLDNSGDRETGTAGRYEYNQAGAVSAYYGYEWDVSFDDFFSPDFTAVWEYIWHYEYGGDGMLKEVSEEVIHYAEKHAGARFSFAYDINGRSEIVQTDNDDPQRKVTLESERDKNGRLTFVKTRKERNEDERRFVFSYEDGGFCVYIKTE